MRSLFALLALVFALFALTASTSALAQDDTTLERPGLVERYQLSELELELQRAQREQKAALLKQRKAQFKLKRAQAVFERAQAEAEASRIEVLVIQHLLNDLATQIEAQKPQAPDPPPSGK